MEIIFNFNKTRDGADFYFGEKASGTVQFSHHFIVHCDKENNDIEVKIVLNSFDIYFDIDSKELNRREQSELKQALKDDLLENFDYGLVNKDKAKQVVF